MLTFSNILLRLFQSLSLFLGCFKAILKVVDRERGASFGISGWVAQAPAYAAFAVNVPGSSALSGIEQNFGNIAVESAIISGYSGIKSPYRRAE